MASKPCKKHNIYNPNCASCVYGTGTQSTCSICGKTFKPNPARKDMACAVLHAPGDCCHYSQTEVKSTQSTQQDIVTIKKQLLRILLSDMAPGDAVEEILKVVGK